MKKLLAFIVSLALMVCFAFPSMAVSGGTDNNAEYLDFQTFSEIMPDYTYLTQNDEKTSNEYFNELKKQDLKDSEIAFVNSLIPANKAGTTYSDNVMYIQQNYKSITSAMTNENKKVLDKYIIKYALLFYYEYDNKTKTTAEVNTVAPKNTSTERIYPKRIEAKNTVGYSAENNAVRSNSLTSNSGNVCTLRVYSDDTMPPSDGTGSAWSGHDINYGMHSWITVTNISDSDIQVGAFWISPNTAFTLGTWSSDSKPEHNGIWYDLEGHLYAVNGELHHSDSIAMDLDQSGLDDLNSFILDGNNDAWSGVKNCSTFASKAWNRVSTTWYLSAGIINNPYKLAENIRNTGESDSDYSVPTDYEVYYGASDPTWSIINNYTE